VVPTQTARKLRGAWYTPPELVDAVVDRTLDEPVPVTGRPVRVLDPACGDGRFLVAVAERLRAAGHRVEATGCDVDGTALDRVAAGVRRVHADALTHDWGDERFDVVVGNPPFLSQMASATTRGGASRHGGGPYADAAAEFLSLSVQLADPGNGRVGLVLPQSILAARDAGPVREEVARLADLTWTWWEPSQRHFDASVNVCALGFRRPATGATTAASWTRAVTDPLGVPAIDPRSLDTNGTLGDRAELNANFRDEYYALVPAVGDDAPGPPLVTSGLIDPGVCWWGRRPVRFAKTDFRHPRVDLAKLTGRFPAWAARKLVPKVLVANQTRVVEAVADPEGAWLPGVPVTTVTPPSATITDVWELAAVLTSPTASVLAWSEAGGTGLSATAVRIGPAVLGGLPWPGGRLDGAVAALRTGQIEECGALVDAAYGIRGDVSTALLSWWTPRLPRPA
jgi:hypothetical protein